MAPRSLLPAGGRLVLMLLDNLVVWAASGKWITGVERVSRGTITQTGDSVPAGLADGWAGLLSAASLQFSTHSCQHIMLMRDFACYTFMRLLSVWLHPFLWVSNQFSASVHLFVHDIDALIFWHFILVSYVNWSEILADCNSSLLN
jgi:hypothetical protein